MEMTPQRWDATRDYLARVFGGSDPHLATLMDRARAAGLPDIAVSPDVGRLLQLLATTATQAPAARGVIIEVGTLAGYSGIWLARALPPAGRLIAIEFEPKHAAFAQREFEAAGLADRVQVITGAALDVLPRLARELGPASIDVAFIDAVKTEYLAYFEHLRPMIRPRRSVHRRQRPGRRQLVDRQQHPRAARGGHVQPDGRRGPRLRYRVRPDPGRRADRAQVMSFAATVRNEPRTK
ncbi:MAG TPA: class I SAM-dependent methyltransferase [Phycisphaerales bacterium]|nr:class I SAM-dependent methyltransferase [Phycisphaerales bacterium]